MMSEALSPPFFFQHAKVKIYFYRICSRQLHRAQCALHSLATAFARADDDAPRSAIVHTTSTAFCRRAERGRRRDRLGADCFAAQRRLVHATHGCGAANHLE